MNVVIVQDIRFVVVYPDAWKAGCINKEKYDEKKKECRKRLFRWMIDIQDKRAFSQTDRLIRFAKGRRNVWDHIQALVLSAFLFMGSGVIIYPDSLLRQNLGKYNSLTYDGINRLKRCDRLIWGFIRS